MTEPTHLDIAHRDMETSGAEQDRVQFYARIAETELFVLLQSEATGATIEPRVFELSEFSTVVAFDRLERLVEFADEAVPYVAVSGKTLVQMLADQGFGLGLNLDVAPSSMLLPPDAVLWLRDTLANTPSEVEAVPKEIGAPPEVPQSLLLALDGKLALASGLAASAYFCSVTYENGVKTALLAIINAVPGAEDTLSQSITDALTFSGVEAGMLDVIFVQANDPLAAKMAKVGLRFDIPEPPKPAVQNIKAPGSDPSKPPRLR